MYERFSRSCVDISTRDATVRKLFYQIKSNGKLDQMIIEDGLAEIETKAGIVMRDILAGKVIDGDSKGYFSVFLASLYLRTSNAISDTEQSLEAMFNINKDLLADDEHAFHDMIRAYEAKTGTNVQADLNDLRAQLKMTEFGVRREFVLIFGIVRMLPDIADVIDHMNWTILRHEGDYEFLTSDNPVALVDPISDNVCGTGFRSSKLVQVTCPLSTRCMLLMTRNERLPAQLSCNAVTLKEFNRRTVANAEKYVFGASNSTSLGRFIENTKGAPPYSEVRYDLESGLIVSKSVRSK